ncbi:2-succinyl-5-enolpyruvyl-6-hydroxy-3-cyclohexene-1-carboxylic-acid synthase [Salinibaculum rarum]|uniref:2-succinyl-5-enolpyruvyl-6-hydroxy-3- cyclohexene-1-carboxylic-acid synthase n=1 Tax=Salinibaculum rarum TaxID=3058903 RepID=UPI00265E358D|nr:2-succinyl-5-enolpyruvyl-6-hydroxy-3-cyclohexene-1-carboxylic-acid synthase [Salinibaculum sp. KK48]
MTAPNRNTLWGQTLADELAAAGVDAVCLSPGSRSTPLTVAFADHPDIDVFSHLDERSSAFFALGRARRTGDVTAVVCTSGTAAANFHPAVLEASESRVPLLLLTADRPPELQDSGANQTTRQEHLYGDAVRAYRTLPEPEADARKLRSLRVTAARAVRDATETPAGPVHLNVPFRKPLEPTEVPGDVPDSFATDAPLAATGRDGPFVTTTTGTARLEEADLRRFGALLETADRGLLVCGPSDGPTPSRDALRAFTEATGVPVLADPLSGHRFGAHVDSATVCGGYDSYLDGVDWPDPDVVVRTGFSPTSKVLRQYLRDSDARQLVVDPAGDWPEAEFTATDHVVADPSAVLSDLADVVDTTGNPAWRKRFERAESRYWDVVEDACEESYFEGAILHDVATHCPDPTTLFVSNSMPVRDLDRFGRPRPAALSAYGNRGVSGIDGITSTALGAGSATDDPLVLVTGDIAYYHDMNGLLALARCDVDATIVLVNNDGGGIFHILPIEDFDPPFTEHFETPHGLDFEATEDLYDLSFERVDGRAAFLDAFESSVGDGTTTVIELQTDGEESHRFRERFHDRVCEQV